MWWPHGQRRVTELLQLFASVAHREIATSGCETGRWTGVWAAEGVVTLFSYRCYSLSSYNTSPEEQLACTDSEVWSSRVPVVGGSDCVQRGSQDGEHCSTRFKAIWGRRITFCGGGVFLEIR